MCAPAQSAVSRSHFTRAERLRRCDRDMAFKVSSADGVKVYNVSSGKSIPEWISEAKRKSLQKSEEYRRRIELIQDLEFPEAAHRVKASPDGKYILATGIHPPRLRCFDLSQLSLKFEHHLDSEVVDFEYLSDDYSKLAMVCRDRTVVFQSKSGTHHKSRIPRCGRDMAYYPYTADLLIAASCNELYRLNLEEGRFHKPLSSGSCAINKIGISPVHGLVGAAGEDGVLECFDVRQEKSAGRLDAASAAGSAGSGLTALRFDDSGLQCAVGTSSGIVAIFDLRSSKPMLVKDHLYSAPIVNLKFHSGVGTTGSAARSIISADKHIVRVWDSSSGQGFTNIQPPKDGINDVLLWKDSGLLLVACDDPKIQAYFVPSLGPAPKWCSFLEGLTEELEETDVPVVYDDYKFVTRDELQRVGMSHLVGTSLLRAYMHGFFMHNKLWQKAKAIASPLDYEVVRKERIQAKIEAERAQRITLKRKLPKVNAALAAQLASQTEEGPAKRSKPGAKAEDLLSDERFNSMFTDPAYAIDERAEEYRLLHPNTERKRDKKLMEEHFEELEPAEEDSSASGGSDGDDSSDDDDAKTEARPQKDRMQSRPPSTGKRKEKGRRQPGMLAAKSPAAARAFDRKESLSALHSMPLAERSERAVINYGKEGFRVGGQRELTFTPSGGGRGGRGGSRGRRGGRRGGGGGRGRGRRP